MNENNEAPVLLITFNRADNTRKVFEKIREAKIKKLYVANDAPRPGNINDEQNRKKIREMLNEIDWDCELHTLFHEKNQGNGFGPVAAYNWFFEKEEMGIILEDDTVPVSSFFEFCNYCLRKYKDDTRIWAISGVSHHSNHELFNGKDYIFTRYAATCAWATWKRCWRLFDMNLSKWDSFYKNGGYENVFFEKKIGEIYNKWFNNFHKKPINSWDARFLFLMATNSGFGIVPSKNLIKNIGIFGAHTNGINETHKRKVFQDFTFKNEPDFVCLNRKYEILHFNKNIKNSISKPSILIRILRKVYNTFKN